jgi:hypothetical protein
MSSIAIPIQATFVISDENALQKNLITLDSQGNIANNFTIQEQVISVHGGNSWIIVLTRHGDTVNMYISAQKKWEKIFSTKQSISLLSLGQHLIFTTCTNFFSYSFI